MKEYRHLTEEEIRFFVYEEENFYVSAWEKNKDNKYFKGWNWAAFFFMFCWLAYRKMYLYAVCFYVLNIVFDVLLGWITYGLFHIAPSGILNVIFLIITFIVSFVVFGYLGNFLYYRYAQKTFDEANAMDEESRANYLRKKSGTSRLSILVALGISVAIKLTFQLA